jgi:hypothetical protein
MSSKAKFKAAKGFQPGVGKISTHGSPAPIGRPLSYDSGSGNRSDRRARAAAARRAKPPPNGNSRDISPVEMTRQSRAMEEDPMRPGKAETRRTTRCGGLLIARSATSARS